MKEKNIIMDEESLMETLKKRFQKHMHRHKGVSWDEVEKYINKSILISLRLMESTGGEPDVIELDSHLYYIDMSKETPKDRRNICYDEEARLSRKKLPPKSSATKMAEEMGINLLEETMYFHIQELEQIDLKTSSWLKTPREIRILKGALFGDHRYGRTFIYHNGADSYYGVRGFRGYLKLK